MFPLKFNYATGNTTDKEQYIQPIRLLSSLQRPKFLNLFFLFNIHTNTFGLFRRLHVTFLRMRKSLIFEQAVKGTVSRVAHARLSASRSSHAVISRHYRYGFAGNMK